MKNRYDLERAATNFKWWIIGVFSVIAIGTASAMYVGGELESALFEKLATDPTGTEGQVYYNTTEKKAKLYNGSAWTDFGSGDGAAGAGEINYNDDPDGASNWTELGDGVTVSTTVVETEIPRWPIKTQAVKLTNDTTGTSGWSVCVEVGEADRNKKLKIEWAQLPDGTNYTSGDFEYQLVSETNDTCTGTETGITLHSSGDANPVSIPNQAGVMYDEFDATDAQYYELKFLRDTAAQTNSGTLAINDLVIGPGKLHSGAVVTAWENASDLTVSGFGTVTNNELIRRRVGDTLEVFGRFTTGTVAASTASIGYPGSSVLASSVGSNAVIGSWWKNVITASAVKRGTIYSNAANVRFGLDDYTGDGTSGPGTSLDGDEVASSSQIIWVNYRVPISSYEGSGVLNVITQDNINEWTLYPSTVNFAGYTLGNGTEEVWYRRVGSDLEIRYKTILGTTSVVGAGSITMRLPTDLGLTVDTTRFSNYYNVGVSTYLDSGTPANSVKGSVMQFSNGCLLWSDQNKNFVDNAIPFTWASGDQILFECRLPILEWAGSQSSLVGFSAATATQSGLVSKVAQKWAGNKSLSASNITSVDASSIAAETVPLWKIENDVAANGSGGGFFVETRGQGWGGMSVDAVTTADAQVKFWTSTTADTPVVAMTLDRDQNATVTGSIGAGSFASSLKNKYQIKTLSADVTASGTLSDLTFSNLTIGKVYRVTLNASVLITGTSATELATIRTTHNSATIATARFRTDSATDATTAQFSSQVIFTASATTVTFEFTEAGTQVIQGNNNQDETFAMIEELVNYEVTSAF